MIQIIKEYQQHSIKFKFNKLIRRYKIILCGALQIIKQ